MSGKPESVRAPVEKEMFEKKRPPLAPDRFAQRHASGPDVLGLAPSGFGIAGRGAYGQPRLRHALPSSWQGRRGPLSSTAVPRNSLRRIDPLETHKRGAMASQWTFLGG
ncbi:hypothetical protein CMUS01_12004 [Colletotrichum musicola]|uniref:Uncharacterized protein n=1 Tax=Colletotrichum musicola TaxID=2175873 RepID=A0A8H6JSB4_9PEZI|nr:hypothetical protein CMUS01_12004 [Colletotrichum musicola]